MDIKTVEDVKYLWIRFDQTFKQMNVNIYVDYSAIYRTLEVQDIYLNKYPMMRPILLIMKQILHFAKIDEVMKVA